MRHLRNSTGMTDRLPAARARRGTVRDGVAPEVVRVRLLGGFRVSVGPRVIREDSWRLRKAASLIKLLALAPGHRLHREQAMDLLWPDLDTGAAANNLHRALYSARRTLEPRAPAAGFRYLRLREGMISLCPEGTLWVDIEAFEDAAATARRTREPAAYRAAMELYAGRLLPEDLYEEWTEESRGKLGQLYHGLLLELAGLYEGRAEYRPSIEVLRESLAEDPLDEEAHAGLMRLYALRGEWREAILLYEEYRNALSRELGAEPGPAIRRLYEEIRAGRLPAAPSAGRRSEEPIDSPPNNLPP